MPVNEGDYALVVGINDYPNFRPLQGAIEDAERFAHWLVDKTHGGGLPDTHCKLVRSTPDPIRPIQDDIDEKLQEIIQQVKAPPAPPRRIYVYFSGHGLGASRLDAALCLARWSELWRNAALDATDYLALALGLGVFQEVVFFMDCCRVRKVSAKGLASQIGLPRDSDLSGANRLFLGFATEHWNPAYEATVSLPEAPAAGASPVRGHFSRALLDALNGAAAAAQGGVPASRLKEYLEAETPRIAQQAGHQQKPEIINGLPSNPEPIFGTALPAKPPNVHVRFKPATTGVIVLEDGDLKIVKQAAAADGPWSLALPPGLYLLRKEASKHGEHLRVPSAEAQIDVEF